MRQVHNSTRLLVYICVVAALVVCMYLCEGCDSGCVVAVLAVIHVNELLCDPTSPY